MVAKLMVWIDGRWRSLEELRAEGRSLKFAVLRKGIIKVLSRPPKVSSVVPGAPLHYRQIKQHRNVKSTITDNGMSIVKDAKGQQPLAEVQRNAEDTQRGPVANAKPYKSFLKPYPNNHNVLQEKTVAHNNISEAKNLKTSKKGHLEKENVPKNIQKSHGLLTITGNKNLSSSQISDKLQNVDSSVESLSSGPYVELVVEPEVLELMRRFLIKTPIFKVDIDRFDKDEAYKQAILYKLQPVVQVAELKPGLHHQLSSSLRSTSRSSLKQKATTKPSAKFRKLPKRSSPIKFRKSSVPLGREYSSLEDHAIVSWLSASREREHAVNGNRVWRELQPHHVRLTGHDRTWHSLRNRYLRYILPALGLLALSPSHAQRLRASAATGEIKGRTKRRPSILHERPVHTARSHASVRAFTHQSDIDSDGILHHEVRRPSFHPEKRTRSALKRPQAEKRKYEAVHSDSDEIKVRQGRKRPSKLDEKMTQAKEYQGSDSDEVKVEKKEAPSTLRNPRAQKSRKESQEDAGEVNVSKSKGRPSKSDEIQSRSPSKKPQTDKSKKESQENVSDEVKTREVERQTNGMEKGSKSPLKGIQTEKRKRKSDSDSDEERTNLPKKRASKKRDSEESDSDGAVLVTSRLRPRPVMYSGASDDDSDYLPRSPLKKKRRKLFNPFA